MEGVRLVTGHLAIVIDVLLVQICLLPLEHGRDMVVLWVLRNLGVVLGGPPRQQLLARDDPVALRVGTIKELLELLRRVCNLLLGRNTSDWVKVVCLVQVMLQELVQGQRELVPLCVPVQVLTEADDAVVVGVPLSIPDVCCATLSASRASVPNMQVWCAVVLRDAPHLVILDRPVAVAVEVVMVDGHTGDTGRHRKQRRGEGQEEKFAEHHGTPRRCVCD